MHRRWLGRRVAAWVADAVLVVLVVILLVNADVSSTTQRVIAVVILASRVVTVGFLVSTCRRRQRAQDDAEVH